MNDDYIGWKETISGAAAVVAGLVSYIVHGHSARMTEIEKELDGKASQEEMNRQRDNISEVFKGISIIKDMLHNNHAEVLRELSKKADR